MKIKILTEASDKYYVTTYIENSCSGPEEGGYTTYGWEARSSKPFNSFEDARTFQQEWIGGDEIISDNGRGEVVVEDNYGDKYMVVIETPETRGSKHAPARSWAEFELGVEPESPFFDGNGRRLPEDPDITAKRDADRKSLQQELETALGSATNDEEAIKVWLDDRFTPIRKNNSKLFADKIKSFRESMTIGYDEESIKNQIRVLNKNIEDYEQLIVDEPEDKDYWQEMIDKCKTEIEELNSYEPIQEKNHSMKNRVRASGMKAMKETFTYSDMTESEEFKLYKDALQRIVSSHKGGFDNYHGTLKNGVLDVTFFSAVDIKNSVEFANGMEKRIIDFFKKNTRFNKILDVNVVKDNTAYGKPIPGKHVYVIDIHGEGADNKVTNKSMKESAKTFGAKAKKLSESPVRKKLKVIKEASYGGAFDIEDDQFFTRDDLNEFGYDVVDALNTSSYSKFKYAGCYIDNGILELDVEWDGNEVTAKQKIDMRKIKMPSDLYKRYSSIFIDKLKSEFRDLGADVGTHMSEQDYPITEDSDVKPIELILTDKEYVNSSPVEFTHEMARDLDKYLRDNKLYAEEMHYNPVRKTIEYDINNGDWKHEHLRSEWLVQEFFENLGASVRVDSYETEGSDGDWYSAHYTLTSR